MSTAVSSARKPRNPLSAKLRARMEAAVEHMLALLDELDGDPDIERDPDSEESDTLDEHGEHDTADEEYSLGWRETKEGSQEVGSLGVGLWSDLEGEHDGREPMPPPPPTIGTRPRKRTTQAANTKVEKHIIGGTIITGPDGTRYRAERVSRSIL